METDSEELLKIGQVAVMLKVTKETLRRWDKSGRLKAIRLGERWGVGDRRYRKSDIDSLMNNGRLPLRRKNGT